MLLIILTCLNAYIGSGLSLAQLVKHERCFQVQESSRGPIFDPYEIGGLRYLVTEACCDSYELWKRSIIGPCTK